MLTVAFASNEDVFQYLKSGSDLASLSHDERDTYEACLMRVRLSCPFEVYPRISHE